MGLLNGQGRDRSAHQRGDVHVGLAVRESTPVDEPLPQRFIASRQRRVHDDEPFENVWQRHRQRQAEQASPVLHHQRHIGQPHLLDERQKHVTVSGERVEAFILRLVGSPETQKVGCHHTLARLDEHGQHLSIKVAPGRLAMETQHRRVSITRTFVQVVHPQALETSQVRTVVRRKRAVRQL